MVDIFDLLEEQLGEAEDLEAHFPRGEQGLGWSLVKSPQGEKDHPLIPTCGEGPNPAQNPPRGASDAPRGEIQDRGNPDPHQPSNVSVVVNMVMDTGSARIQPLFGLRVHTLGIGVREKAKVRGRVTPVP